MHHAMLACGPHFDEAGFVASLVLLLLIKPLGYFAYVRAFRYRVCAAIPMSMKQTVGLAALRGALGIGLVGAGAWVISTWNTGNGAGVWAYLYLSRIFAWWVVGLTARLRGRRMAGWIAGGMVINFVFDAAVLLGLAQGVRPALGAIIFIIVFVGVLERRGNRMSLLARFPAGPRCGNCEYNLTGNLSGICPECGTPVVLKA